MANKQKYDLYSHAFKSDACRTFAAMREEDPVFQQPGLDGESTIAWVLLFLVLRPGTPLIHFCSDYRICI